MKHIISLILLNLSLGLIYFFLMFFDFKGFNNAFKILKISSLPIIISTITFFSLYFLIFNKNTFNNLRLFSFSLIYPVLNVFISSFLLINWNNQDWNTYLKDFSSLIVLASISVALHWIFLATSFSLNFLFIKKFKDSLRKKIKE